MSDSRRKKRKKLDPVAYYCQSKKPNAADAFLQEDHDLLEREMRSEALSLKKAELSKVLLAEDDHDDDGPVFLDTVPQEDIQKLRELERKERTRKLVGDEALKDFEMAKERRAKAAEFLRRRQQVVQDDDDGVVYRDEDGFRITRERWLELEAKKKGGFGAALKAAKQRTKEEPPWMKGQTQIQESDQLKEKIANMSVELPAFEISQEEDKVFREQLRPEDPMYDMLMAAKKEEHAQQVRENIGRENAPVRPKCLYPSLPNRFSIAPGYRWDGVVRGNGYEQRYLAAINDKTDEQEEYDL